MLRECEKWVDDVLDTITEEPTRQMASLCELKIGVAITALAVERQVMKHIAKWSEERRAMVENMYQVLGDGTELGWGFIMEAWGVKVDEAEAEATLDTVE